MHFCTNLYIVCASGMSHENVQHLQEGVPGFVQLLRDVREFAENAGFPDSFWSRACEIRLGLSGDGARPFALDQPFYRKSDIRILWLFMEREEFFESGDRKKYKRVFKKGVNRRGNRIIKL